MAEFNPVENLSPENQRSLKTLARSLTMSQGQFSLIFARCNYASLRERVRKLLREQSAVAVQELYLPSSAKSLYGAIADAVKDNPPQALMVFGVEAVFALDELLTAANRARDRFRRDFSFPMVLWVTDAVLSKLGRLANDLNTWAGPPIHFTVSPEDLREFLCQKVEQGLNCESNLKLEGCDIEAIAKDLPLLGENLDPELQACWEFIQGTIQFQNKEFDAAIAHYKKSLTIWQQQGQLERQGIACIKIAAVYNRKAELHRAENQNYWQKARSHLQQALTCFQKAKREKLVAQCMSQLGEVLQYLEAWQELEVLAKKALAVHINNTIPANLIAQNYAFLAQAALSQGKWKKVNELAKLGLTVLAEAGMPKHQESLHLLLLLGKSQRHLGQETEALATLEEAKQIPPQKDSMQLYLSILEELQELYKESHEYLKAFELKLEQQELETKYRLRAFIGAGRLQPPAPETLNLDLENPEKVADVVEEIVTTSGRQQDVNRLIERVGRADCKLTVLYGQSGVGKSSIVQAGLIPALKLTSFDGWDAVPVLLQVYTNWVQELGQKLAAELVEVKAVMTPPQLENCEAIIKRLRQNESRRLVTVLIFDQFEEFFFDYKEPESRRQFYLFLSQVLHISYVKVILSLREDYLNYLLEASRTANLDIIDNDILNKNTLYYLGNFSRSDAKKVIASLTERSQFYLQPELVDALVEELASELGEVRPIELQVVGSQLQADKITTLARYRESGPKKALVERFLQSIIQDCGPDNQDVAKLILYLLTDDKNTRPQKTRDVLELELGMKAATLDLVLEILVKSGLVIRLHSTSSDCYQLVHDYLVAFIRNSQFNPFSAELERERAQRKITQERLIQVQKQQLKAARRATVTLVVGLVGTLSLSGFAGWQWRQAEITKSDVMARSAEILFSEGKELDALMKSLRARVLVQHLKAEPSIELLGALQQVVSGVRERNRLETHIASVSSVSFSPDGKTLASGSSDKTIKLWDVTTGKEIRTLKGHSNLVLSVSFSPDGKTLASGSLDHTIKLWYVTTGKEIRTLNGHSNPVVSVSFSPDGKTLASGIYDHTIKLWDVTTGKEIRTLNGHSNPVVSVSFSPDGKTLASGSYDHTIKLWDVTTGKEICTLKGHSNLVFSVSFSPDGKTLASGSYDHTIKLWDVTTCQEIRTLNGHSNLVSSVSFSPDGKTLASGSSDKTIKLWDVTTCQEIRTLKGHSNLVRSVSFSPDGKTLASGSSDKTIKLWDVTTRKEIRTLNGHSNLVSSVSFSRDGKTLASGSEDNTIKLWDATTDKEIRTLNGHRNGVFSVSFSPDGKTLASGSSDNTIKLWDVTTGKEIRTLNGHSNPVVSVSFSPDGKTLASGSSDNTIKLWDVTTGKEIRTLNGHSDGISSVSFSPDGKTLASGSSDKTIKLWDVTTGKEIRTLNGHSNPFVSVSFSPDGKTLASGSEDNTIKLWDVTTGKEIRTLNGHSNPVVSVSFSPDGKTLASGSSDNTIKLWDVTTGKEIRTLNGHSDAISSVSFSPDGKTLASGSSDNTVILWNVDFDGLLVRGCDKVRAYLHNPSANVSDSDRHICDGIGTGKSQK